MPDGRLVRVFVKFLSYRARYFGFTHFMFAFVRHNNVVRLVELVFVVLGCDLFDIVRACAVPVPS